MNEIEAALDSEDDGETDLESEAAKLEYFCKESVKLLRNCNSDENLSIKFWDLDIVNYQFLISYYSKYFHSSD